MIHYTVALGDPQKAEDSGRRWAVGSPCHASWWWGVGRCYWFLMVYLRQSASPPVSHGEPTLQFPHTKQSVAIFAYGIPPDTSGCTVCSLKPLPLLLCCERHHGMDLCKIRLREKNKNQLNKKTPNTPDHEIIHEILSLSCACRLLF